MFNGTSNFTMWLVVFAVIEAVFCCTFQISVTVTDSFCYTVVCIICMPISAAFFVYCCLVKIINTSWCCFYEIP